MGTDYSGIAAAHDLDVLLSHDDFEPAVDVDTVALDAAIEALAEAQRLVETLTALRAHLAGGGDAATTAGLSLDVHLAVDAVASHTADLGGYEPRGGVIL